MRLSESIAAGGSLQSQEVHEKSSSSNSTSTSHSLAMTKMELLPNVAGTVPRIGSICSKTVSMTQIYLFLYVSLSVCQRERGRERERERERGGSG